MAQDGQEVNDDSRNASTNPGKFLRGSSGILQLGFKFIELIFCIVSLALISEAAEETFFKIKIQFHHVILAYSSFVSYIIINLILILARFLNEPIGLRASLLYSIVGAGLFFVTAIFLFVDKSNLENYIFYPRDYVRNMWTASACFALLNALVFVADAVYTFLRREDFE